MDRAFGWVLVLALASAGCGSAIGESDPSGAESKLAIGCAEDAVPSRTASCVRAFEPGEGAGFGQDRFPAIVYGEPRGAGLAQGSLDVLSLGGGGLIEIGFGSGQIKDGEGADFIVFENAFHIGGNPEHPYAELGEVSVSDDGETWVTFPCEGDALPYEGCAGWRPVLANPDAGVSAFDPEAAGGDPFDLADVGLSSARFVRIVDRGASKASPNAGFDLDAVAVVHAAVD